MNSNYHQPSTLPPFRRQPTPILLTLLFCAVLNVHASKPPHFSSPVNFACTNCDQICTGDFDGDGKLDLVASSSVTHILTIFTNNGSGSLVVRTNYTSPGTPRSIAVGDFNGDIKLDILAVNYPNDSVTVWTGNGNGTFASPKVSSVSINDVFTGVAVGDFNNDGKLDVVVATYGPRILLGRGDGFFDVFTNYFGGTTFSVATGNFNNDTNLDFVTGNYSSSSMSVFLANGDGTFPSRTNYSGDGSEYHYSVAVGDFNNDAKPDLATINYYNSSVSVRTNTGNGVFGTETRFKTPFAPKVIAVADFNGDGNLDILTANSSIISSLAILCGNGNGTFATALTNFPGLSSGVQNQSIDAADFDGDGRPDIASTCTTADSVTIRLNQTLPELQIQQASASQVRIIWPSWPSFVLESTTNLLATNSWSAVAGSSVVSGGQNVLTNLVGAGNGFFRLKK